MQSTGLHKELRKLLSSMPQRDTIDTISYDALAANLSHANRIIMDLVETACAAVAEPGFSARIWQSVLDLLDGVVAERIDQSPEVQTALQLTDDQLFSAVWNDTLKMCNRMERSQLRPFTR